MKLKYVKIQFEFAAKNESRSFYRKAEGTTLANALNGMMKKPGNNFKVHDKLELLKELESTTGSLDLT